MVVDERKQARRKQELRRAQQRHREKKRREGARNAERKRREKSTEPPKRLRYPTDSKPRHPRLSIFQGVWQRIWRRLRILFGPTKPPVATRMKAYLKKHKNLGRLPSIDWRHDGCNRYVGYDDNGYHYQAWPSKRGIGYCVTRTLVSGNQFYLGKYYELEGMEETSDENTDNDQGEGQHIHSIGL